MAEARINLEPEVQEIFRIIDKGENFLLSGGAGSGKTYSLVQVIKQVLREHAHSKIACMTYTNAAVAEIKSRITDSRLEVGTIHEFLWDLIRPFKSELVLKLIESLESEAPGSIKPPSTDFDPQTLHDKEIQYKEYTLVREAIISHDEVLILAHGMFKSYPKLCDIAKDRYRFIFIDEYQDTSQMVIEIFLEHFLSGAKNNVVGFLATLCSQYIRTGLVTLKNM